MPETQKPSVERFEQAVMQKEYETACTELLAILQKIDSNFGEIKNIECNLPPQLSQPTLVQEQVVYFCNRMAVAITQLFQDPGFGITYSGAVNLLSLQRWIALIFASSPFINADHVLRSYNQKPDPENPNQVHLDPSETTLLKFCVLYVPESNITVNLDTLWENHPKLCAGLCFALQSPRFIGTEHAFSKRSAILQWFPEKLAQIENLDGLPSTISHDVYMHCSYDTAPNKHDVKKSLNQVIRRHLLQHGWQDRDVSTIGEHQGKPVMIVLLEHFHSSHSIYRTHSTSMVAARQHFHLVGIGTNSVDQAGKDVFDEFKLIAGDNIFDKLYFIKDICEQYRPAVFYMPSIGMDLTPIFASNTRLAPIQAVALGHPATTHSDFIEYVIVEDDYVGSENCFSETLLRLPKDALPYVPSALAPSSVEYRLRENPSVVNIGIASTTMKLNPYFLAALKAIRDKSQVKLHFHFALGQSCGITHPYVERFIKSYLGEDATAHPHAPYDRYLYHLYECDMMLNPFPFGNTNGIIDMVTLGLVGICKTGDEVHEHIDEGLFKRLGLPEWLIANTVDEYVERAVYLAENHQIRLDLRRHIIESNGLQTLFKGNPAPMGEAFLSALELWKSNISNQSSTEMQAQSESPNLGQIEKEQSTATLTEEKSNDESKEPPPLSSPLVQAI